MTPHLGGEDFDNVWINYSGGRVRRVSGIDLRNDLAAGYAASGKKPPKAKIESFSAQQTDGLTCRITADATGTKNT